LPKQPNVEKKTTTVKPRFLYYTLSLPALLCYQDVNRPVLLVISYYLLSPLLLLFFFMYCAVLCSMRGFKLFCSRRVPSPCNYKLYFTTSAGSDASGGRMVFALNARDHDDDMVLPASLSTPFLSLLNSIHHNVKKIILTSRIQIQNPDQVSIQYQESKCVGVGVSPGMTPTTTSSSKLAA
jgi:hypothetical protein